MHGRTDNQYATKNNRTTSDAPNKIIENRVVYTTCKHAISPAVLAFKLSKLCANRV